MSYTRPYTNQASSPWAAGAPPGIAQQPTAAPPMSGFTPAYAPQHNMYHGAPHHVAYDQSAQWMSNVIRQPWTGPPTYDTANYVQQQQQHPQQQHQQQPHQRMPRSLSAPRAGAGNAMMKRPNQNWNDGPVNKRQNRANGELNNNYNSSNNNNANQQARRSQQQQQQQPQHQQRHPGQNRNNSQTRGPNMNGNVNSTNNINNNNNTKTFNKNAQANRSNNNSNSKPNKQHTNNNNNSNNNNQANRRNNINKKQVGNNAKQQVVKAAKKNQPTTTTKDGAKTKHAKKIIVRKIVKKAQVKGATAQQEVSKPLSKNAEKKQSRLEARKNSESLKSKNYQVTKSKVTNAAQPINGEKSDAPEIPVEQLRYVPAVFGFCCKLCDVFVKDRFLRAEHINSDSHQEKFKVAEEARLAKVAEEAAVESKETQSADPSSKASSTGQESVTESMPQNEAPDSAQPSQ